jgi:hypothetical protein
MPWHHLLRAAHQQYGFCNPENDLTSETRRIDFRAEFFTFSTTQFLPRTEIPRTAPIWLSPRRATRGWYNLL